MRSLCIVFSGSSQTGSVCVIKLVEREKKGIRTAVDCLIFDSASLTML